VNVAPLYRIFLADAQAAARVGDTGRMLECIGLALDFAAESQRERVLLAAAELVPPAAWSGGRSAAVPVIPLVVKLAVPAAAPERITWEPRPAETVLPRMPVESLGGSASGASLRRRSPAKARVWLLACACALGVGVAYVGAGGGNAPRLGDPVARAARAIASGDAEGALSVLAPLGSDVSAAVWLARASAHEALMDTAAAVRALSAAAANDGDGGSAALDAGDRLLRLGRVREAADAYLYAVTPARTPAELDRIAFAQEQAGYPERAGRVRRR
jgi:hypothetical protein